MTPGGDRHPDRFLQYADSAAPQPSRTPLRGRLQRRHGLLLHRIHLAVHARGPRAVSALPPQRRNALLATVSVVFYVWGARSLLLLFIGSLVVNYVAGR